MKHIKELRLEVGMSQKEMIVKLGVKQSHYSSLENEIYFPKNKDKTEARCIEILKPLLIQKIITMQSEVERLEYLLLQLN